MLITHIDGTTRLIDPALLENLRATCRRLVVAAAERLHVNPCEETREEYLLVTTQARSLGLDPVTLTVR